MDIIRIPLGRIKEVEEMNEKLKDWYYDNPVAQKRNNDFGKSFAQN